MTVTNHVFADIAVKQDQLIRKALDGSVFKAAMTVALPTSITIDGAVTGTPTLAVLDPDDWGDLGLMSDDGAKFSSDTSSSDIMSWGRVEPSRRDITKDVTGLHIVMQETKLDTVSSYLGIDPATVTPDVTTGEVHFTKPTRPSPQYYRLITLGVDQNSHGEIYCACIMPRASVTGKGDLQMDSGGDGVFWDTTWTAYTDSDAGFAVQFRFGGAGWKPMLADMGWS
ncbi:MAG TPA: hypothetical protein VFW33_17495 [Gemmataceae bacterium]|nr:hypothetical protein [Gemmataceae bacterium]